MSSYDPPASTLVILQTAANHAHLTRSGLQKAVASGKLWAIRPGYEWLTTLEKVDEYLDTYGRPSISKSLRRRDATTRDEPA